MPLKPIEPPEQVQRAAAAQVHQLATPHGLFPALRSVVREDLELVAPHRMYTLGADAIIDKRGLDQASSSGWRFLVADHEKVVASAELDANGEAPSLNGGPYVQSTAAAIDELERLPAVAERDYELRILKVPALYLVAAWLAGDESVLVPLAPAPSFIEAGRAYSESEFLAALEGPASAAVTAGPGAIGA